MKDNFKKRQDARLYIAESMVFIISTYLTISFGIYFIINRIYQPKSFGEAVLFFMLICLFWWGFYRWFKKFEVFGENFLKEHIYALFTLTLIFFLEMCTNVGGETEWVLLLFYPFMICCIYNGKIYFYWSVIYFCTFVLYQMYFFLNASVIDDTIFQLFTRFFYCVFAIILGYYIFYCSKVLRIKYDHYQLQQQKEKMFQLLNRFVPLVESRGYINRNEIRKMSQLIEKTAGYFPEEDIQAWEIDLAALVHYVTWIYTPDYLYEKEEILTVQEREMLKKRVEFGADLLLDMKEVERVRLGILYHREYINGQGYPYRLRGEEIPIFAQIIGIVDEYMDLINPRINGKKQHTTEEAMTILSSLRNVCYQEKIVSAFEKVVNEMENIRPKG